ncbi:MAG: hypothetical protein MI757_02150 [Pirellulales bacterium]|nr:hypothetical protein [Pirellulales bacterium]
MIAKPIDEDTATPLSPREAERRLLELLDQRLLTRKGQYEKVRNIAARQFEYKYRRHLRQAFGDSFDETTAWLNEHRELKEEFFLAINPQYDDVPAALTLFYHIKQSYPDSIVRYGNVAIALAVTWDRPDHGIYRYAHHQTRAKAIVPTGSPQLSAMENFAYLVATEKYMQGRVLYVPWEFLVHVVNHTTPKDERKWAIVNYAQNWRMIGRCYHHVPYDKTMLNSHSRVARLNGHEYTLRNLRRLGGVCAHQADYSCRIAKSIGIPAAYVIGESNSGEMHAWVMWVELISATRASIGFRLASHGRYRGDQYYVGQLRDPQTGQRITDRQLELRLHTVGVNSVAKRHAALVMAAYPALARRANLGARERVALMTQVIRLCPGNEAAWLELARLTKNEAAGRQNRKQMLNRINTMFATFGNFPDFTWTIFQDLVAYEQEPSSQHQWYERLVLLYEQARRPDLACEARLKLTDLLEADKKYRRAIKGLGTTILKFPDEGRYVPRMLDRAEALCAKIDGSGPELVAFYCKLLPRIPKTRGDAPSRYCMAMFKRAIRIFRENGRYDLAGQAQAELDQIRKSTQT